MTDQGNIPGSVLMVDDDEDDIFFFSRLLRKAGLSLPLRASAGGDDATKTLAAARDGGTLPSVCFLDVKMPGVNGFDVLAWIRGDPAFDGLLVFMLSSSEHPSDLRRAEKLGAQCYFQKHPSEAEIREIVARVHLAVTGAHVDWLTCPANLFARTGPQA